MTRAEQVANAVLYEGYILYPYRPSSVKNQQRWNFGVVYPPGSAEGASAMQTQCLAATTSRSAELDVNVRFLHLVSRSIVTADNCSAAYQPWQEAVERNVVLAGCRLEEMLTRPERREFLFPSGRTSDSIRDSEGRVTELMVREQECISGIVEVFAERVADDLVRITVSLQNITRRQAQGNRDGLLLESFVSAHKILTVRGAEFLSLTDPPKQHRELANECRNVGTWPVLAGEEGERNVMLSSPIILYDYPQIAPESAGDLCDGTEIDEILSLRILTLTDEEKREVRRTDEHGRRILERTENLQQEQWMKLHGVLRGLRPYPEASQ